MELSDQRNEVRNLEAAEALLRDVKNYLVALHNSFATIHAERIGAYLALPAAPAAPARVRIRFDGSPGPEAPRFVEVEDVTSGRSIRWGEWVKGDEEPYWFLMAPAQAGLREALANVRHVFEEQVQMCHDREAMFNDVKVWSRPPDWQAMTAEMYRLAAVGMQVIDRAALADAPAAPADYEAHNLLVRVWNSKWVALPPPLKEHIAAYLDGKPAPAQAGLREAAREVIRHVHMEPLSEQYIVDTLRAALADEQGAAGEGA